MSAQEILKMIKSNDLFENVGHMEDVSDEKELLNRVYTSRVVPGEIIFSQGDKGDSVVLLLKGKAGVYVAIENGTEIEVAAIKENNFFGEMAIIDDTTRMASVRAISDCMIGTINAHDFWHYFDNFQNVSINLMKTISRRLRSTNQSLIDKLVEEKNELIRFNEALEKQVKEKTEHLKQSNEHLIQSEKMASLGQLVAGVAHEINTPVGIGVTASSHLVKSTKNILSAFENKKMSKSDLEKYLDTTVETSELILSHLMRTANLVKSFKMVSADQTSRKKRRFEVKSYIENIIQSLQPKLKKKSPQVTINCRVHIEIDSYPGVLAQIITNFIVNSLIHAFVEDKTGKITIDVEQGEDEIVITYSDDGTGMSEEAVGKIFDPFFTTKRGSGGTGLGMHIVYNSVTQILKGQIFCESVHGKGTKFILRIPVTLDN